MQQAEADFDPLPFDAAAARAFGGVAVSLRKGGREPAARAYDAMIAATAVANDLPVFTCNPADFTGIDDRSLSLSRLCPDVSALDGTGRARGCHLHSAL